VEGRGRRLEAKPGDDHRQPEHDEDVAREALRPDDLRDAGEVDPVRGAVDERAAEEQRRRAE
jgi:hypothetical protein